MADYCSQCSPFEEYDIDLFNEALMLERGHSVSLICEGCNIKGIYKDESGGIYLARLINGEVQLVPVTIEELIKA